MRTSSRQSGRSLRVSGRISERSIPEIPLLPEEEPQIPLLPGEEDLPTIPLSEILGEEQDDDEVSADGDREATKGGRSFRQQISDFFFGKRQSQSSQGRNVKTADGLGLGRDAYDFSDSDDIPGFGQKDDGGHPPDGDTDDQEASRQCFPQERRREICVAAVLVVSVLIGITGLVLYQGLRTQLTIESNSNSLRQQNLIGYLIANLKRNLRGEK